VRHGAGVRDCRSSIGEVEVSIGINKLTNEYASLVDHLDAPKAVWMAVALSLAMRLSGEDSTDKACRLIVDEWDALFLNGVVPQNPWRRK
jgi:hypothetical protein